MIALALLGCTELPLPLPPEPELMAHAGPDRVVPIGVAVKLDGRDSVGADAYSWDAGDGETHAEAAPLHIYDTPGNYTAILRVTGADGATRTDTTRVVVHAPFDDIAPTTASTLAIADGGVWGVVGDGRTVFWAGPDGVTHTSPCDQPVGVAVSGTRRAVLCGGSTPELIGDDESVALPIASRPAAVTAMPDGFVVSLSATGERARIGANGSLSVEAVGPDVRAVANLGGEAVMARFRSDPTEGRLWIGDQPLSLGFDPGPDTDTGNRGVPNLLTLAAAPDGETLYVAGTLSNTARGAFVDGSPLTHDTSVRAFFSIVDRQAGERVRRQFDDQGSVSAVVVNPLGNLVFVAFPGTHTIMALDGFTGDIAGSILDAGRGIDGLALSDDGVLYVNATLDREVRAYDVSDLTVLPPLLWSQRTVQEDPLSADVLRGKQLFHESGDERLAEDGYISCAVCHPGGDHDGQTWDFTDRGEGLRNTTSLLGRAGMGMGPVHWTGNFDEIQDFEHDIRGPFSGEGLMNDADFEGSTPLGAPKAGLSADLDALAAYVATLDQTPTSPFPLPDDGIASLIANGCDTCHPAPLFTDSALDVRHDIGTLGPGSGMRLGEVLDGLDTPTLLGAWDSAPYLHDGSAATLEEAISAHDGAPTDPQTLQNLVDAVRAL